MNWQPAELDTYGCGLSPQEKEVLDMSASLYNAIAELPDKHPSDMAETLLDIHRIQNRVMARVAVRNQPNFFKSGANMRGKNECR